MRPTHLHRNGETTWLVINNGPGNVAAPRKPIQAILPMTVNGLHALVIKVARRRAAISPMTGNGHPKQAAKVVRTAMEEGASNSSSGFSTARQRSWRASWVSSAHIQPFIRIVRQFY